jgi:hypothetical protein
MKEGVALKGSGIAGGLASHGLRAASQRSNRQKPLQLRSRLLVQ